MLRSSRAIAQTAPWRSPSICCFCVARSQLTTHQRRSFAATANLSKQSSARRSSNRKKRRLEQVNKLFLSPEDGDGDAHLNFGTNGVAGVAPKSLGESSKTSSDDNDGDAPKSLGESSKTSSDDNDGVAPKTLGESSKTSSDDNDEPKAQWPKGVSRKVVGMSLKDALLKSRPDKIVAKKQSPRRRRLNQLIKFKRTAPEDLHFEPVEVHKPPVPMLAYGLDRVLFNPGVYRLQDPRTGVYNFDPYLEKIMPVDEFDFDALSEYKTSSKDEDLLAMTRRLGTKYTGSTSSMSSVLQHFHFLLSANRRLDHGMLSKNFPDSSNKFSRMTSGPDAVLLRYKDGVYAIDADKTYDYPNIMSWLGHSMERLLTTERSEFERYRRSHPEQTPTEGDSSRCFHYSKQGSILMRSQLDTHDPRLPGAGIFDLKTRAVVSIRMHHKEYEKGLGYQLRYARGEWESFEREFYDMARATMLKYMLQVRMGRMDGIFIAYHNVERIFGFQYLTLSEMDQVLHGQADTCLGDQEFKLSIGLMEELLQRATQKFPETSIRLHFETPDVKQSFMYVFAEPVTEKRADQIQNTGTEYARDWARRVIGVGKNDPKAAEDWQDLQDKVDEQVNKDGTADQDMEATTGSQEAETITEGTSTRGSTNESEKDEPTISPPKFERDTTSGGPLMGWTLTIRNKVNGQVVVRPEQLEAEDNWEVEYHIQKIEEESVWKLYNATKERRRQLIGVDDELKKGLADYRKIIQRYASRGRAWRTRQDKLNEERGVQLYKPLGPGSPEYAQGAESEAASEAGAESEPASEAGAESEAASEAGAEKTE